MHHQEFKLLHVVHNKFLESIWEVVTSLLVRAIPDIGHKGASLELPPYTRVNTFRPSPVWLQQEKSTLWVSTQHISYQKTNTAKRLNLKNEDRVAESKNDRADGA